MSHLRTMIRNGFVTALTGLPTTGANVFASRVYPLQQKIDLPGLLVAMGLEQIDTETMWPPRAQVRSAKLTVTICLRTHDSLDDDIDAILMEVEPALAMPTTIVGVKGLTLIAIDAPKFSDQGDQPLASIALHFDVSYATVEGVPDVPI